MKYKQAKELYPETVKRQREKHRSKVDKVNQNLNELRQRLLIKANTKVLKEPFSKEKVKQRLERSKMVKGIDYYTGNIKKLVYE